MVAATKQVAIRLSVQDADVVRRALEQVGTKGSEAMRRIDKASRPASAGLKTLNAAAQEGQSALKGYTAQLGAAGNVLNQLGPAGIAVGAGLAVASGAAAILLGDFSKLAERAGAMRGSFETMAGDQGINPATLMDEISQATRGTTSELKRLTLANTALSSGILPLIQNLPQIIKDVRSVSTALGRDAGEDIERVISAINKQEQELLDELGIVARADTAYKKYADTLGIAATRLDDMQKRTAFANLVIGELRSKAEAVGDPINKTADASERFAAAWEDLKISLGSMVSSGGILDLLASGVEEVNESLRSMQGLTAPRVIQMPAGTPHPADVGLFPQTRRATMAATVTDDTLAVEGRTVQLSEDLRGFQSTLSDALNVTAERIEVVTTAPAETGKDQAEVEVLTALPAGESFADMLNRIEQEAREAEEALVGFFAFNIKAETLLGKKRQQVTLLEITNEDDLARRKLRSAQIREEVELAAAGAEEEHFKQLRNLHDQEMASLNLSIQQEDAAEQEAASRENIIGKTQQIIGVFGQLSPELSRFSAAASSIVSQLFGPNKDPFGATMTAVGLLVGELFGAEDASLTYAQQILQTVRATEEHTRALRDQQQVLEESTLSQLESKADVVKRFQETFRDFLSPTPSGPFASLTARDLQRETLMQAFLHGSDSPQGQGIVSITAGLTEEMVDEFAKFFVENKVDLSSQQAFDQVATFVSETLLALETHGTPDVRAFSGAMAEYRDQLRLQARALEAIETPADRVQAKFSILEKAFAEVADLTPTDSPFFFAAADPSSLDLRTNEARQLQLLLADLEKEAMQERYRTVSNAITAGNSFLEDVERRENRLRFDALEMELRKEAQREFALAGADPFARAEVFRRLEASIKELASAETATERRRRLDQSSITSDGSSAATAAGQTLPVTIGSTSVTSYDDVVDLPGQEGRIHLSWEDAVFIDEKYGAGGRRPQSWTDILSIPEGDARIQVAWEDAVFIDEKYGVNGRRPQSWTDILSIPERDTRIQVAWEDAVLINEKYGVGPHRPFAWGDIVDETRLSEMERIHRSWSDVVHIRPSNLSDFGARQWSDMVRLERELQSFGGAFGRPSLSQHQRRWSDVINIRTATLADYKINRWSQMVLLSRKSGGISKHQRSFADLVRIRPSLMRAEDLIAIQPARVNARDLVQVIGKLTIDDLIDTSDFNARVDSRIASASANRQTRDDPLSSLPATAVPGWFEGLRRS